jgi:hypothetical protein
MFEKVQTADCFFVRVKCVRPVEQLTQATIFSIFLSLLLLLSGVTKIPEGVVVGFHNFAWAPNSHKYNSEVSNFVGDISCDIITGGGRTAECLANSWMFGNYQDDFW